MEYGTGESHVTVVLHRGWIYLPPQKLMGRNIDAAFLGDSRTGLPEPHGGSVWLQKTENRESGSVESAQKTFKSHFCGM